MSFFKKLFKKDDSEEQQEYYEDRRDYIDEQPYEYYEEPQVEQAYQTYDMPETAVDFQKEKKSQQQPPLEDVYADVYDMPETQSPFFQEQAMPVQEPVYQKPPADFSPFGQQPQGLIRTVKRISRERYNPFTETGVAPEVRKPRVQHVAHIEQKPKSRPHPVQQQPQVRQQEQTPPRELYVAPKQTFSEEEPVKKKFEPMDVPSPIYGFQEPPKRPIVTVEHIEAQRELVRTINDKKPVEIKSSEDILNQVELRHAEEKTVMDIAEPISKDVENIKIVSTPISEPQNEYNEPKKVDEVMIEKEPTITEQQSPVIVEPEEVVEEILEAPQQTLEQAMELMEQGIEQPVTGGQIPSLEQAIEEELTVTEREVEELPVVEAIKELAETIEEIAPSEQVEAVIEETEATLMLEEADETVPESFLNHVEKTRPFNVVLLPSEKKKMRRGEKAKELEKLIPASPLRPTVTLNSYKKEVDTSTNEVYPSTVTQIEDTLCTEQPVQEPLTNEKETVSTIIEDLNNVKGTAPSMGAVQLVMEEKPEVYVKPDTLHAMSFLNPPVEQREDKVWMDMQAEKLVQALKDFQIEAEIENVTQGPTVTQFQLKVGHGVKLTKITNLADNLKLELAAHDIRIEAPIPGKSLVGIEIPNEVKRPVRLSEITETEQFLQSNAPLEVALGLDLTGQPVTFDLADMPHGLIAGSTGSGKSVCINSIIISLLLKASPQDVKLMLIDPKMVELAVYEDIPHLVSPVITDVKAATAALSWAVEEMERRYELFHEHRVRHISRYNEMMEHKRAFAQKMPYIVIVIDELADLMMQAPQDVEDAICRLTQKARACGIHLVVATQRPSVDVITGLIKSNIPTRIAFAVASNIDSRTILDSQGAERLLGRGDMLYLASGTNNPTRLQGTFVTDEEIEDVTDYVRSLGEPRFLFEPEELVKKADRLEKQDDLFEAVCRHIVEQGQTSTSSIQSHFNIGYNRAARMIDSLEQMNYISESRKGNKKRDVFLTENDVFELFG